MPHTLAEDAFIEPLEAKGNSNQSSLKTTRNAARTSISNSFPGQKELMLYCSIDIDQPPLLHDPTAFSPAATFALSPANW